MAVASTDVRPTGPASPWIHSRRRDGVLAWCWVPFALAAVVLQGDPLLLQWMAWGVLVLSLLHQPITLALVYGDAQQFGQRRRLFTWAPIALAALVFVGLQIDFLLVAVIGGLWNTEHTLMQRYGIVRIYRRKQPSAGDFPGRHDLLLLGSWLLTVLAWTASSPRTAGRIESLSLGTANRRSLELLVDIRPYATVLFALLAGAAAVVTVTWLRRERAAGFDANPAMYRYVAASFALFVVAAIHPVAGLLAWVGSHALEYFLIVVTNLDARYPRESSHRPVLARATWSPLGVVGVVAVFSVAVAGLVLVLEVAAPLTLYAMVFFVVGGLHIFYDGVIWKLRRPAIAATFAIES